MTRVDEEVVLSRASFDPRTSHIEEGPLTIAYDHWRYCRDCDGKEKPGCPDEYAGAHDDDGCYGIIVDGEVIWEVDAE